MTYVLDSNIVSHYLRGNVQIIESIAAAVTSGDDVLVAPVAYYEVRRGLLAVNSQKRLSEFLDFCSDIGVGLLDNSMLDTASDVYADLRKIGRVLEDADIFIAAFCLQHGFTLITNNMKHFENIPQLVCVDWTAVER